MGFLRDFALVAAVSSGAAFAGGLVNPYQLDLKRAGYPVGLLRWVANLLALFACIVMHVELLVYAVVHTQADHVAASDADAAASSTALSAACLVVAAALVLNGTLLVYVACPRPQPQQQPQLQMGIEAPTTTPWNFWVLTVPLTFAYTSVGVLDHSRLSGDGRYGTVAGWAVGYMVGSLLAFLGARALLLWLARRWDENGTTCGLLDMIRDAAGVDRDRKVLVLRPVVEGAFAAWPVTLSFWVALFLSVGLVDTERLDDPATWRPLVVDLWASGVTALVVSTSWARNHVAETSSYRYSALPAREPPDHVLKHVVY